MESNIVVHSRLDAKAQSKLTISRVKQRIDEIVQIKTTIDKKVPDIVHSTQTVADLATYELMQNMLTILDLPNTELVESDVFDDDGQAIQVEAPAYKNLVLKIQAGQVIGNIQRTLKDRIKDEEREDSKSPTVVFSQEHEIRTDNGTVTKTKKTVITKESEFKESDYGEETD